MWLKPAGIRMMAIGISFVAGIGVGTLGIGLATADTYHNQSPLTNIRMPSLNKGPATTDTYPNQSPAPAPVFPRNESGQTYGSDLGATSRDTVPDLIKAIGVDGTQGYLRSEDVYEVPPKTPEEALARQRNREGSIRQIPLYAVDGKTVVGVFKIASEQGTVHSAGR